MTRADIYAQYHITDEQRQRIEQTTYRTILMLYIGALAEALGRLGGYRPITAITDTAVLLVLRREARRRAELIQRGINTRIDDALSKLDLGLSDHELRIFLSPTLDAIREYNATRLADNMARWVHQRALRDAYERNNISAEWRFEPEGVGCSICIEIASHNPYTTEEASVVDTPPHQNCQHEWQIAMADTALEPQDLQWYGQGEDAA